MADSLAVGTVTFNNSARQLCHLLKSLDLTSRRLKESTSIDTSMLVIDNGRPSNIQQLAQEMEITSLSVTQVNAAGNIGFAAATNMLMNQAFADAQCKWFITVNPDGLPGADCFYRMVETAQKHSFCLVEAMQFPEEHPKTYSPVTGETEWGSGACLLISRGVYERLSGFDPNYFLYMEDVDLSWRARAAGAKVIHCAKALFAHPVLGRTRDPLHKRQLFESALYLGHKWKSTTFLNWLKAEVVKQEILSESELTTLETANEIKLSAGVNAAFSPPAGSESFRPDFDHYFSFSETRW